MAIDYEKIRSDNITRYGTDIGRFGSTLLANRYDERTHFIFELLQNADDALHRLAHSGPSRAVSFYLERNALRVSHHGDPFTEKDVRGICGIDESTKEINEIGRFGIGFKSVFAYTDRPQIHSGAEDFAIEDFVWPVAVPEVLRDANETVILIPFKPSATSAYDEISDALVRLGASTLLFLRQIDEISWRTELGASGQYLRESCDIDSHVRRVRVVGEQIGNPGTDEEWLVFSRPVIASDGVEAQPIEIAFSCIEDLISGERRIHRVERSPLVVFFPTVVETHLGFLLQGPYRTTPSRDNIPRDDAWNQNLVEQTSVLLRTSLRWLRDHHLLNTDVLRCLPLDSGRFGDGTMFAPLFSDTKNALSTEPLLPSDDVGFVTAQSARLGRTRELRGLFDATQLAALYAEERNLAWLQGSITQDRTPDLREYLIKELNVPETTPDEIIRRFNREFLESQPDQWVQRLYEFLNGQPALHRWLSEIPLIRLEDGTHVLFETGGEISVFLPTETTTGFPTVRPLVCASEAAREFLISLGLKEPDLVDDVITNVLLKYQNDETNNITNADYDEDISRILKAYRTDSQTQQKKLVDVLSKSRFVKSIDTSDSSKHYVKPLQVYLATKRLKSLLNGVKDVLFVDNSYACLQGEDIRGVLRASGAIDYLQPVAVPTAFTYDQKRALRIEAGCENSSGDESIDDSTLRGLEGLLALLPELDTDEQVNRAKLLWEALDDLETRRGKTTFSGTYYWFYVRRRKASFAATFVKQLVEAQWILDIDETLRSPKFVSFDSLEWKRHPFLESIICFKPPEVDILARKLGIEPGMIELLRKVGIESEDALRERLGLRPQPANESEIGSEKHQTVGSNRGDGTEAVSNNVDTGTTPHSRGANAAPFISYIAVHAKDEEADPDGLAHEKRMALEERAIKFILQSESEWQRTPHNNPGFDLIRSDEGGQEVFCEVKAMTGTLQDRPVGMSHTQFNHAYRHGDSFWLYVVEHAADSKKTRVVRIQDPAGKARTFTYDSGWGAINSLHDFPDNKDKPD